MEEEEILGVVTDYFCYHRRVVLTELKGPRCTRNDFKTDSMSRAGDARATYHNTRLSRTLAQPAEAEELPQGRL